MQNFWKTYLTNSTCHHWGTSCDSCVWRRWHLIHRGHYKTPGGYWFTAWTSSGTKRGCISRTPIWRGYSSCFCKKEEQRQLKFWKLRRLFRPWFVVSQIPGSVDLNRGWVSSLLGMIGLLAQVAAEADLKWIFFHSVFFFKFSSVLLSSVDRLSSTGHCKVI